MKHFCGGIRLKTETTDARLVRVLMAILCFGIFSLLVCAVIMAESQGYLYPAYPLQRWAFYLGTLALFSGAAGLVAQELSRRNAPPARPAWFFPVVTGLLALAVMTLTHIFIGMWPFGDATCVRIDMYGQYTALMGKLRDILLGGGSLLYSSDIGLGVNMLPTFGYYLSSPFNLLLTLFPQHLLPEAFLLITLLKNSLGAAFFALLLQELSKKRSWFIPAAGLLFSGMIYLVAYSWNIMWLDTIMLLPLVVYAFERMMRTGRPLLYTLTLALALLCNYYIGFMLCIFLALWFVGWVVRKQPSGHVLLGALTRMTLYSLIAVLLSAVLLVPSYFGLRVTSAAGDKLPAFSDMFDFYELLARQFFAVVPAIRSKHLPNVACGVLSLLTLPIFFASRGVPDRRKLAYGGLLGVLALSLSLNLPNLVWHGLHTPNDLPYRFSFLYSFVLLLMLYEALIHIRETSRKAVWGSCVGLCAFVFLMQKVQTEKQELYVYYATALILILYAGLLALGTSRRLRTRAFSALVLAAVIAESVLGGVTSMMLLGTVAGTAAHSTFVASSANRLRESAARRMEELRAEDAGADFYRMEVLPRLTYNDGALYGYSGVSSFVSTNYLTTTRLMRALGYKTNGINMYCYSSFVPTADSLLGVRYVALENDIGTHRQLALRDSVMGGGLTRYLYENRDAMPLGYVVPETIRDWKSMFYNPVRTQNSLYRALMTDEHEDVLLGNKLAVTSASGGTASASGSGITIRGAGTYEFTATAEHAGQVFLYVDCLSAKTVSIYGADTWTYQVNEPYFVDNGEMQAGDTVRFAVTTEGDASGSIYAVTLNDAVYRRTIDTLREGGITVTSYRDGRIDATVDAPSGGTLLTTIPYDTGWTVTVDGAPVETFGVDGALLAFDISEGAHTLSLRYTPRGLALGSVLTGAGALLLCAAVPSNASFGRLPDPRDEESEEDA